jgi:hypothetical protein
MWEMLPCALDVGQDLVTHMDSHATSITDIAFPQVATTSSKLMLVLEVSRRGWIGVDGMLGPRKLGDDKKFEKAMIFRSALYFRCLLDEGAIFQKRATRLLYAMPEAYYKCLLGLPDLGRFHDQPDFHLLRNADFERILKSGQADMLALADGDDDSADETIAIEDGAEDEPPGDLLELGADVSNPVILSARRITLHGRTVRFDNATHQSGLQRGWVTCNRNRLHVGCHKYRFIRDFGNSHVGTAAWLLAWDCSSAECDSRGEHYRFEPSLEVVGRIRAALDAG